MPTVLIIDDQELTRMILSEFVRSIGPEIEGKAFDDPLAALGWATHNSAAMALVDYHMPGMDGIEFTRRLHKFPASKDVPVVMITALTDSNKAIRYDALKAGVMDFLTKPRMVQIFERIVWYCYQTIFRIICLAMTNVLNPFQLLVIALADWLNRHQ